MHVYEAMKMALDEKVQWDELVFVLGEDIGILLNEWVICI
jgi:pyruvate/2-oxoglutarate/acetoin dehydrogenase E1 component